MDATRCSQTITEISHALQLDRETVRRYATATTPGQLARRAVPPCLFLVRDYRRGVPVSVDTSPGPEPYPDPSAREGRHQGVLLTGADGADGPKAFYIHIEARPDKTGEVRQMLRDILGCVLDEPATGPWFGVQYSPTTFGIFEVFTDLSGRQAHVDGGGGDIFRDLERMNAILAHPAHVYRLDVLMSKQVFTT